MHSLLLDPEFQICVEVFLLIIKTRLSDCLMTFTLDVCQDLFIPVWASKRLIFCFYLVTIILCYLDKTFHGQLKLSKLTSMYEEIQ